MIATFNFLTPSINSYPNAGGIDAINNYVLKGNAFAKQSCISNAKIIQALLG
jgi:hypothetical protein